MKGVRVLVDESTHKRIIQIDAELVEKDREAVEDYLDRWIIASRKGEPSVSLESFEKRLRKANRK